MRSPCSCGTGRHYITVDKLLLKLRLKLKFDKFKDTKKFGFKISVEFVFLCISEKYFVIHSTKSEQTLDLCSFKVLLSLYSQIPCIFQ